jgi:Ca2+-transporting ATPase
MEHQNLKIGLTTKEVEQAQSHYGPNALQLKKKKSLIVAFLEEFKDLMIIILIAATIISFIAGDTKDASVIGCIIVLNAIIGFIQKYRAEKAVEALKSMLAPHARVLRNGQQESVDAETLVPGDVVLLYEGDRIPADGEIFHSSECETQEAILTGESTPVKKSNESGANRVYMGTMVSHGSARMVVTEIGMMTEFGKIATLTTTTQKDLSPLQKELNYVGIFVGKITLVLATILVGFGIFIKHDPIAKAIVFAASVAVAAVPEGLPTTITIALAIGVQRLAKKNAIVKQLSSVETLGSTTVIVSDKTGTLTKNEMTVEELFTPEETPSNENKRWIAEISTLCNNAKIVMGKTLGDPTEGALLLFAEKLGRSQSEAEEQAEILHELTFDSKRKRMTVIVRMQGKIYALCKGAPDSILTVCSSVLRGADTQKLSDKDRASILETNESGAKSALRMIGFAYRELTENETYTIDHIEKELSYVGMVGMMDPPREEVKEAIKIARTAGIRIIILTGDHALTAKAIGEKIGLIKADEEHYLMTGEKLDQTSDTELLEILGKKVPMIFARVSPENKLRVVELLKKLGEIVAVTGDGVNDAPALKRADIGIAMGIAGTDVTKEAANMVLTDDSFSTIVVAIQEGRTIYENLKKFLIYMFSGNTGELFVIFAAILLGYKEPLTATIILLVNVGTDILPALALGMEPTKLEYMANAPRNPSERILNRSFTRRLFFLGGLVGITSLAAYIIGNGTYGHQIGVSMTYATLVIGQMLNAYSSRDSVNSAFKKPFSNPFLIGAIAISIGFTVATIQLPLFQHYLETTDLNATQWLIVVGLSIFTLLAEEVRKAVVRTRISTP